MDQENRKRARVPVRFECAVQLEEKSIPVRIVNISLTGVLCTPSPFFRKNDACKVTIYLSDDLDITIDAKVLRTGKEETAINFVAMDEESFAHLRRMVQYNAGDADRIDGEVRQKAYESAPGQPLPGA